MLPQAIAYATAKNGEEFPIIVVYDGQLLSRGRVVVDSTWHHWLGYNNTSLVSEPLEKTMRYYANVAIWLAQPGWRMAATVGEIKRQQFSLFGIEEFSSNRDSG